MSYFLTPHEKEAMRLAPSPHVRIYSPAGSGLPTDTQLVSGQQGLRQPVT